MRPDSSRRVVGSPWSGVLRREPGAEASRPAAASGGDRHTAADRKYLLERVDDAAVVQLYADGFAALPLRREDAHLAPVPGGASPAATSSSTRSTRTRSRCAACSSRSSRTRRASTPPTLAEIQRYTKLFWINNGPYNNLTARKFVLKMHAARRSPRRRRRAAQAGATFPTRRGRIARRAARRGCSRCSSTRTSIRSSPTRRPGRARTSCTASANNLYSGVTMADLKGFTERYGLNSRLVKRDGKLVEEVYKVDGRYAPQITRDRQAPRGGDCRSPPSRWPRRCAR